MRRCITTRQWLLALPLAVLIALVARPARADELSSAQIVYVAPNGDDAQDCTTPATRCATLQRALEALADGGEARLATGVYTGTTDIQRPALISGGYALPDYSSGGGVTVLDGQRLGTTLRIAEPVQVRLARLAITGGLADPSGETSGRGGGIFIRDASVVLDHVGVYDNIADTGGSGRGGGIYIRDGSLTLTYSTVTSNTGSLLLPTVSITDSAAPEPPATNLTGTGGGIYAQNARVTLRHSLVSENRAIAGEAGLTSARGWGGGMYAADSTLDTFETMFQANHALGANGGGAALKLLNSLTRLRGGEISANRTDGGSIASSTALDIVGGTTALTNLALRSRSASTNGILLQPAAAILPTTELTLTNVLLTEFGGAALQLLPNGTGRAHAAVRHTTVVSNGVGILAGDGQTAHIIDSLIAQNDIGTQTRGGTIALEYTDRYANRLDADGEVLLGPGGGLALPPRFVAGDSYYRLAPESPLLDQGMALPGIASDFEEHARSADGDGDGLARPDLGWDELARSGAQFGAEPTVYGLPGQTISTTIELRNMGPARDSFQLSLTTPVRWSASVTPAAVTLGPLTRTTLAVTINIPAQQPLNSMATITIEATGRTSKAIGQIFVGVGEP
jgi:hypothetical protein